jgi:cystathionine beta-synthase
MLYKNLLELIGNTPLIKINFGTSPTILAKLEHLNPGGSLKDRSALYMIEEAECTGQLKPGGTIIEASSGNQGIAAAMIGAYKGYKIIVTVSDKFSKEKVDTLRAYGAQVVVCPATAQLEDPQSYHSTALKIHQQTPNSIMLNQYFNPTNTQAHYLTLGPEIWQQTQGTITHFFAAAGTCGHSNGAGRYLKKQNPSVKVIPVDAQNSWLATKGNPKPYKIEGIGIDFDAPLLNRTVVDEFFNVTDEQAIGMLKTMARSHGLLVGPSSGAVAYAVQEYSKKLNSSDVVVMVLGDSGRAYLTKGFYTEDSDVIPAHNVKSLNPQREVNL